MKTLKLIVITIMSFVIQLTTDAQSKSLGAVFSFTGLALEYEHYFGTDNSFIGVSLKAEMPETFIGRKEFPGVSSSFVWNISIKEWPSSEGNTIRFFAGPGISIGYVPDFKSGYGVFIGLKGRVGLECDFIRDATISLSMSPVVGSHVIFDGNSSSMKFYRNGLLYTIVPEVGIKHRF